jgi:ADP-heptose:LPS heptosyltransferase
MIIISPYTKALKSGKPNPKDYPYWEEVLKGIDEPVVQIGLAGEKQLTEDFRENLSFDELRELLKECRTWIACDSFFQHFAWRLDKKGIVIFSRSDPLIFGHKENINLLKGRDYLSPYQFIIWEEQEYNPDAFVEPNEVIKALEMFKN